MERRTISDPGDLLATFGRSWWLILIWGAVTLLAGILTIVWPDRTIVVVAILVGIQFLVAGVLRLISAFAFEGEGHRAWDVLVGLASVVVGILCLRDVFQTIAALTLIIGILWVIQGIDGVLRRRRRPLDAPGTHDPDGHPGVRRRRRHPHVPHHVDRGARLGARRVADRLWGHADRGGLHGAPARRRASPPTAEPTVAALVVVRSAEPTSWSRRSSWAAAARRRPRRRSRPRADGRRRPGRWRGRCARS